MDRRDSVATFGQRICQALRGPLGLAEDHRQPAPLGLQQPGDHLFLVEVVSPVDELGSGGDRLCLFGRFRTDVQGVPHVPAGQAHHGAGHGGGEEHGLPELWCEGDDLLDVRQETEVEHLVGLVEHEHLDMPEVEVTLCS